MRKILLTVFCLCSVGLAYGQSKLDLQSQLELFKLRNTSIPTYNSRTRSFERPRSVPENTMAMVELKDQNGRADLEAQGVRVRASFVSAMLSIFQSFHLLMFQVSSLVLVRSITL